MSLVLFLIGLGIVLLGRMVWQLPGMDEAPVDKEALLPVEHAEAMNRPVNTPVHRVDEWGDRPRAFFEAPALRALVEAGSLPPVEERLPQNPLVIIPVEQAGPYGGTWRRFGTGMDDIRIATARLHYDGLVRWDATGTRLLPNLAVSWEISEEGRVFTFELRRGVRWSDGEPFTADDVLFWYEHILRNSTLTPAIPADLLVGGEVMQLTRLDDFTLEFRFARPNGLFIEKLASGHSQPMVGHPRHYLSQFHPELTPEAEVMAAVRARNLHSWHQLFRNRAEWRNPDMPTLNSWVITRPPPASPVVFERNPYYWKVDDHGNQLPYIDAISVLVTNPEIINFRLMAGESQMQSRHVNFANYPLLMENRDKFGFRVREWQRSGGGHIALSVNVNHREPAMAEIFRDPRFRKALSLAIDRRSVSEVSYHGLGVPRQMAPPPTSLFYDPDYEKAYTEFDLEKANRLLDEMGLVERDIHGIRKRSDGRPISLQMEHTPIATDYAAYEIITGGWRALGLNVRTREQAREIFNRRTQAYQHDITAWGSADEHNPLMSPNRFFPVWDSHVAPAYGRWFTTGGRQGEKPEGDILRCMEIYWEIEETVDPARRIELFREILELNRRNLWMIGVVGELPELVVVGENMRNIPERAMTGWIYRSPGNTAPESYAIGVPAASHAE
jgi:peptide/nickel transport system substrate-binding protein